MSEYIIDLAAHNASAAMALCDGIHQEIVRCRDCREVRHELPTRVGNYERAERWVCARWKGCETLPDAFCSFGKRAAK